MRKKIKIILIFLVVGLLVAGAFGIYRCHVKKVKEQTVAARKISSLQEAISLNNLSAVEFLLKNGVDIEQRFGNIGGKKDNDFTALGWAMFTNRPEIARYLIENGADVKASMPMESMLFWAISFKMEDVAETIIEKGGEITPSAKYNPATHAEILDMPKIVSLLAEKGIKPEDFTKYDFSEADTKKKLEK